MAALSAKSRHTRDHPGRARWGLIQPSPADVSAPGLAAFAVGPRVYAFSAPLGKWDVLERKEGADGQPIVYRDYVLCEDDEQVYVFGAKTGRWDAIETE